MSICHGKKWHKNDLRYKQKIFIVMKSANLQTIGPIALKSRVICGEK